MFFRDAISNDIYFDEKTLAYHKVGTIGFVNVPRLVSLDLKIEKDGILFLLFSLGIWFVWPVLALFFFTYKLIRSLFYKINTAKSEISTTENYNVAVCLQAVTLNLVKRIPDEYQPDISISVPNYKLTKVDGIRDIDIYQLITLRDLLLNFVETIWVHIKCIIFELGFRNWLYSHYIYDWLLYQRVLKRELESANTIIYGNTHDRWAMMLDQLPICVQKIMMQHGVLPSAISFPEKIGNCDIFFYMADQDIDRMKKYILSDECNPDFIKQNSELILKKAHENADLLTVLIILSLPPYDDYIKLAKNLGEYDGVKVVIKTHPSYPSTKKITANVKGCIIWDTIGIFPDCDLVISAPSTLAVEYENMGRSVYMFKEISFEAIEDIVKDAKRVKTELNDN